MCAKKNARFFAKKCYNFNVINTSYRVIEYPLLVEKLTTYFADDKIVVEDPYIYFRAKKGDLMISIFKNKNNELTTVFLQGDEKQLPNEIRKMLNIEVNKPEKKLEKEWLDLDIQIGSDEVGVGDLFAPICVCASIIEKGDIPYLKTLRVMDSKNLSTSHIKLIAPRLIRHLKYSQLSLSNEKYNELIKKGENLNSIKAKLHNAAILNLKKRYPQIKHIYIDQFVNEKKYYEYLNGEREIVKGIIFKTEGESYYPSVAASSIIARYSLLRKMEKLENKYSFKFPLGANNEKIDQALHEFSQLYGEETLAKLVKQNFKNYVNFIEEKETN